MTEPTGDIIANIRANYNQFTRAEKKVANFILEHSRDVLFMSITELADSCGIGDTSVFRFCRTMGLDGYQEFKLHLSMCLQGTAEDANRLSGDVLPEDDITVLVQKVLQNSQRALSETAALLDPRALERVADLLLSARRIAFFGVGASLTSAQMAANKFLRIEPKVVCFNDAHMQAMQAATMTAEDVAVVFSYSGSTKDTNAVARLAKRSGAKVIAVTRFQKSPLTEFTDVTLLCAANENPFQSGSLGANICQSFLVDMLYTEYYRRNFQECSLNNEKTASSVFDKLY